MTVYKYAGFWRRLVAYTIDNLIIYIIFAIFFAITSVAFVFGFTSASSRTWLSDLQDPHRIQATIIIIVAGAIYMALSIAYFTYFHGVNGRTPGKMLLGLQVLSADGTAINFGVAFLRAVGYIVSSLLFTIPLGFIWTAFDSRKQGWHDKIAGTVVIIKPDENGTAGLTIPEPQAASTALAADDKQDEISNQTPAYPEEHSTSENMNKTDYPGSNNQKIP